MHRENTVDIFHVRIFSNGEQACYSALVGNVKSNIILWDSAGSIQRGYPRNPLPSTQKRTNNGDEVPLVAHTAITSQWGSYLRYLKDKSRDTG